MPSDDGRYERMFRALDKNLNGLDLEFASREVEDACRLDKELEAAIAECAGSVDAPAIGALFRTLRDKSTGRYVLRREDPNWRLEQT